jgi:hypothetical protein
MEKRYFCLFVFVSNAVAIISAPCCVDAMGLCSLSEKIMKKMGMGHGSFRRDKGKKEEKKRKKRNE